MKSIFNYFIALAIVATTSINTFAQVPTNCFEIESILVNACGTPENGNEMVRFKIGPSDLMASDMVVSWPNNSWLGLIQDGTTATTTANINATITACGYLVEPVGDVLPAGSDVLLISSQNVNVTANSFENLSDTLVVIYQNLPVPTNTGHFSNGASTPRTLEITFNSPSNCSDQVSYIGADFPLGTDGDLANFEWDGTVSYANNGCQAPITPLEVDITSILNNGASSTTICPGDILDLTAQISGSYDTIIWEGNNGSFSSINSLTNSYTSVSSDDTPFEITVYAISRCADDTVWADVTINLQSPSIKDLTPTSYDLCSGSPVTLNASGGTAYLWSTTETTSSISVSTPNTYTVNISDGCYDEDFTAVITQSTGGGSGSISGATFICDGGSTTITASQADNYNWSTGSTNTNITITTPGDYYVLLTSGCGQDSIPFTITDESVNANFSADSYLGQEPFDVVFTNGSSNANSYVWDFGNGDNSTNTDPSYTFLNDGTYTVTLTASNGSCSDIANAIIVVTELDPIIIPNIFTPNSDQVNDEFKLDHNSIETINGLIYNRWGQKLYESNSSSFSWDGKNEKGKAASEGTYYYVFEVTLINGEQITFEGPVQLVK